MSSKWITPNVKQRWVSSATLLNKIGTGMMHGTLSCLQAAIRAPDSTLKMDLNTSSWFVRDVTIQDEWFLRVLDRYSSEEALESIKPGYTTLNCKCFRTLRRCPFYSHDASSPTACFGISALFGLPLVSIMMDRLGRRTAFLVPNIPGVIGMILIGTTSNIPLMFLGRLLCGICAGSTACLGAVIIGEYTCPENRGMLLNTKTTCINVGSLICIILGYFYHWRTVAIVSATPFVLSIFITYTWPESPFWLAEKKKFKKSEEAFYWLRGKSEDSTRELEELLRSQRDNQDKSFTEKFFEILTKFKKKNFQKPAFIIVISILLFEFSGRHIFLNYATLLVEEITSGNANPFYYSIIINILIIISGIISAILIRTIGVRKLLFTTGIATVIVLFLACVFLYLVSSGVISKMYAWLPLFLYAAFFFLSNLGCTSVPLALVGELFPLEHRAFGSTLAGYTFCILFSVALKILPYMVRQFMIYGAFAILGVGIAVCLIILYFLIPETKDRTLLEIEDYFNYGKFREGDAVENDEDDVEEKNDKSSPSMCPSTRQRVRKISEEIIVAKTLTKTE